MIRVLLATEGESDEVVAERLLAHGCGDVRVDRKRFPARGWLQVERLAGDVLKAGHFALYDAVVMHFDINGTADPSHPDGVTASPRWKALAAKQSVLASLPTPPARTRPLEVVFMAPCQATEAWLAWGRDNRAGLPWEQQDRHSLKRLLFGDPPRRVRQQAETLVEILVGRLTASPAQAPPSLQRFCAAWAAAVGRIVG